MNNHLLTISIFVVLLLGFIPFNQSIVASKHEEKQKSDSNNDKSDTTTPPTDDNKQSTTNQIPLTGIPPTIPIPTIAASQTCSDGSDKTNDKICVESAANQEQAVSQPPVQPTPQSNPIPNTNPSSNPSTTTPTNTEDKNVDNQQDSSGGSTSSSSSDEQSTDEEKNNFFTGKNHNDGIDDSSRYILVQQDGKIALFSVISDEKELDTGVLPQTIRAVHEFDNMQEALSWLSEIDDNNNS
jgi:hypothetical protein